MRLVLQDTATAGRIELAASVPLRPDEERHVIGEVIAALVGLAGELAGRHGRAVSVTWETPARVEPLHAECAPAGPLNGRAAR